jgi:hypothetical protein
MGRWYRGFGLLAKRRRGTHKLRREAEPTVAEVQALAKGRRVVLVGRHILEEGGQDLAIHLTENRRSLRRLGRVEKRLLIRIYGICSEAQVVSKACAGGGRLEGRRWLVTYTQRADRDLAGAAKNPSSVLAVLPA